MVLVIGRSLNQVGYVKWSLWGFGCLHQVHPPLLLTGVGCNCACESVLSICMGSLCLWNLLEFPGWAGYGKEDEADRDGLPSWSWGTESSGWQQCYCSRSQVSSPGQLMEDISSSFFKKYSFIALCMMFSLFHLFHCFQTFWIWFVLSWVFQIH